MDCEPGKVYSTYGTNHISQPKRVRWANDLEEIVYYFPYGSGYEVTELKTVKYTDSGLKNVETKVDASKTKRLQQSLVATIRQSKFSQKMQKKVGWFAEKVLGPSGEVDFELFKEVCKHREDLASEKRTAIQYW